MEDTGKIAGICVTKRDRIGLCCRAVRSFLNQSYPNKELIVVAEDDNHAREIGQALMCLGDYNRAAVVLWSKLGSLEDRFTKGIEEARGRGNRFFTFWDDDNESHRDRLARQVAACSEDHPSFLGGALWHYLDTQELFVIDFEERFRDLWSRIVHASVVAAVADLDKLTFPAVFRKNKHPGTAVARALYEREVNAITRTTGEWWWFKVGVRGDNLHGYDAHRRLASDKRYCAAADSLLTRRAWIDISLAGYDWDEPVDVCGFDGIAYSYTPTTLQVGGFPPIGQPSSDVDRVKEET
jgi:glycosyltransferase involved in cell wall biosynthesis